MVAILSRVIAADLDLRIGANLFRQSPIITQVTMDDASNLHSVSIWRPPFPGMGIPMLTIRRSWDRLIFNMGIPILVRQHLYIETPLWSFLESTQERYRHDQVSTNSLEDRVPVDEIYRYPISQRCGGYDGEKTIS